MIRRVLAVRVLGPVEALDEAGETLAPGGPTRAALLAFLALAAPKSVTRSQLVDALWGEDPPPSVANSVQVHVSALRKVLGRDVIVTVAGGGYCLSRSVIVDAAEFEAKVVEGRGLLSVDPEAASSLLAEGLGLWRGTALADVRSAPFAETASVRLEELRMTALEARITADLTCGRASLLVGELQALVADHPWRESFRGQLMRCLYHSGQQSDALAAYETARLELLEEFGLDPSPALQALRLRILNQDDDLPELPSTRAALTSGRIPSFLGAARTRPLVGREGELDELRFAWEQTNGDRAPVFVAISGEPGIGKTRLCAEFAALLCDEGVPILAGRCREQPVRPFEPFAEALHQTGRLRRPLGDRSPGLPIGIDALFATAAQSLQSLRFGQAERAFSDVADDRWEAFDAVATLLSEITKPNGALLVLDDLQWATEPTLALLRFLVEPRDDMRLMVLGTFRDARAFQSRSFQSALADIDRRSRSTRISLVGLDEVDVALCLATSDPAAAATLRERSKGNPYFVWELIDQYESTGKLDGLPARVEGAIRQRVGLLADPSVEVLTSASVLGPTFDLELISWLFAGMRTMDDLIADLDQATHLQLVSEDIDHPGTYAFRHDLVRESLLGLISRSRRRRVHERIVDSILAVHGESEDWLAPLAFHAAEGARPGTLDQVVQFAVQAAQVARRRLAAEEAQSIVQHAVDVLSRDPHATPGLEAELRLELVDSIIADPNHDIGELTIERVHQERLALDLARRSGDGVLIARACDYNAVSARAVGRPDDALVRLLDEGLRAVGTGSTAWRAKILANLANYWMHSGGQPDRARELADEARAEAERSGDQEVLTRVLVDDYQTLLGEPLLTTRQGLLDRLVQAQRLDAPGGTRSRPASKAKLPAGPNLVDGSRRPPSSVTEETEFLLAREALERGDPGFRGLLRDLLRTRNVGRGFHPFVLALIALVDGDFEAAERFNAEGLARATQRENHDNQTVAFAQLFLLRREQGRVDEVEAAAADLMVAFPALKALEVAVDLARVELGRTEDAGAQLDALAAQDFRDLVGMTRPVALWAFAELCAHLRNAGHADRLYNLLDAYSGQMIVAGFNACCLGAADRSLGQVAALLGRDRLAEHHYERALQLEQRLQAPPLEARTKYWFGRLLVERSAPLERRRGRTLLAQASEAAHRLGMLTLAQAADGYPESH